jgi:hypothetical protein
MNAPVATDSVVHHVTFEHRTSKARRTVQLLKVWEHTAQIWWPLCGAHLVEVRGQDSGYMWHWRGNGLSPWRLIPSDLRRLQRRRPIALYDPGVRDEE